MSNSQESPVSQLLRTLGITRKDLEKHSNQMREFLTSENASSLGDCEASEGPPLDLSSSTAINLAASIQTRLYDDSSRNESPPHTPMKKNHSESSGSARRYHSMEMVIERQRRQSRKEKRARRAKQHESYNNMFPFRSSTPSPDDHSRQITRAQGNSDASQTTEKELITHRRSHYYREHTELDPHSASHKTTATKVPLSNHTPVTISLLQPQVSFTSSQLTESYLQRPTTYAKVVFSSTPATPKTPKIHHRGDVSPFSLSSPAPSSISTPHRLYVNVVSSPGPMGPPPEEKDYDKLPFTLPLGPYSPNKPELSYAALIGQAILCSNERRLTLQQIYDWITIVYPYFKRGEHTWMNSIRHVLSTTVCFRKIIRNRSLGRTQWAIWDEDLECFEGGGFRKNLCKDFVTGPTSKEKQYTKGKGKVKQCLDYKVEERETKRYKMNQTASSSSFTPISYTQITLPSWPLFPPTNTSQRQPYYESCLQIQPLLGDVIFPPIPTEGERTRISLSSIFSSSSQFSEVSSPSVEESNGNFPPFSTSSESHEPSVSTSVSSHTNASTPKNNQHLINIDDDDVALKSSAPGKNSKSSFSTDKELVCESQMTSSSVNRNLQRILEQQSSDYSKDAFLTSILPSTNLKQKTLDNMSSNKRSDQSRSPIPSTPPRILCQLPYSSIRTPLSSRGINPATLQSEVCEDDRVQSERCLNKTPRKRCSGSLIPIPTPVTPRKLVFSSNQNNSPFRSPGGFFSTSPFRTPGSRAIFDPHDPRTLLDDELNRLGRAEVGDSPSGLFGKARGSLLYDSPVFPNSPGRWWK